MPEVNPLESLASLLEKILAAIDAGNATTAALLSIAEDTLLVTQDILKSNKLLLESSMRIEQILAGGGEPPAVPTEIKVTYQYKIKGEAHASEK